VKKARSAVCWLVVVAGVAGLSGCDLFVSADGRVERARADIAGDDYRGAIIELKNALESDPAHVQARLLLAKVSLHLGDARAADKELRRAREAGAAPAQLAELTAETRLALGDAPELLAQIDSNSLQLAEPLRSIYRGEALLAMSRVDEAATAFEAAQRSAPQLPARALIGLARARAAQRRADEALQLLDTLPADSPEHVAAQLARGEIFARQGRFADARSTLQAAVTARQRLSVLQQATLLATLGESELAAGDVEAARGSVQSLAELAPNAPITLLLGARIAMASQDYARAAAGLQRVLAAMPEYVPARFLLGAALLAQGNLNQADSHLARVLQDAPDNLEARKLLAQVRLRMGRPDAVLQLLSPLQTQSDSDVDQLIGLAHMQLGQSGEGLSMLERGASREKDNRQRQLDLAATYLQAHEFGKAAALLRGLPHEDGAARREALLIAAVAATQGLEASDREINGLLEAHPKDVALANVAAVFLAQRGEYERARALLGRALAQQPEDTETLLNSARIESAAGNAATAAARLQGILTTHPDNAVARMGLAELALRANDLRGAAAVLAPLRAGDPAAIGPRLALARVYLLDRRTEDAAGLLTELDKLAAGNAGVTNAIGLLYLDAGRYDEAGARFKKATDIDGNNAQYWLNQARTQLALDRRALARESLERARSIKPDSVIVVAALAMLDVRDGKPAAGAQRITALRKEHANEPALLALEGDFYAAIRDYESADRAFQAALKLRPTAAISVRAYNARRDGKLREATAPLEAWVSKKPDDFGVQAVLAEAYASGGQRRKATEKYEFVVENSAPNAVLLNNLAWLYYEAGDARAESTAARAYQLMPSNSSIADTYGWILVEGGKVAEGMKILEGIEAHAGPDVKYHYAAALARGGDKNGARQRLRALVDGSEPFNAQGDARRLLQELSGR
jgi:putative PEP-CTERM system TPR-repeat lipoprotein